MSNYGQAALSIVGFVVGSYFGYPQLGFVLGSLAGQALFPTQLPGVQGPRLQDVRTTQAQVGAPVMEVFGTDAVPGVVMYTGPVEEVATTEEVGGKGGPEQDVTTYTYFQTLVLGLCRGPMGGIKQIFENGKLVYDRTPQRENESDTQYANRIAATDAYETTFTLYLGDEEQLPDPTLEAELGIGNVPGFRGLMYLVFPDRELKQEQGLRHPNFKVIVFDAGSLQCEDVTDYSQEVMFGWQTASVPDPRNCLNDHEYTGRVGGIGGGTVYFDTLSAALSDLEAIQGRSFDPDIQNIGFSHQRTGPASPHIVPYTAFPDSPYKYFLFNEFSVSTWIGLVGPNAGIGNGYRHTCNTWLAQGFGAGQIVWWAWKNQDYPNGESCGASYPESGLGMLMTECNPGNFSPPLPDGWVVDANGCIAGACNGQGGSVAHSPDGRIQVARIPRAPDHPCFPRCGVAPPDYAVGSGYCVVGGRILAKTGAWVLDSQNYHVLRALYYGGGGGDDCDETELPLNPARPVGHADDTQAFWEAAYQIAVNLGYMAPGLTYGVDYPETVNHGYQLDYSACTVSTEGISIAEIVRRLCSRVGLTDIDVSDLEDRYVTGYVVSRVMNVRDAIEPLRLVGYFDVVESGRTLKFPARGKAAVRTLEDDDLGAHEYDGEVPPAVSTRKMQDVDLPRQIRLHYRDPGRDYEDSEQLSPTRLTTDAVNDVDIECPIAITAQQAAEAAEVNWASAWAGRWIQQTNLGLEHFDLEPADCVVIPVDGRLERVRLVTVDGPALLRKIEAVRDDADGYVSVAIAEPPVRPPQEIVIYSPTTLLLLDLPALRPEDNDAGVYAVSFPTNPDQTWGGVRIYHSTDGGLTFTNEAAITTAATVGELAADLPAGDPFTWDDSTEILVELESGAFESRTEAAVLDGANALAIGRHRFWEIVQFTTAEQLSATQWRLTHLLRGRRGTEYLMGTGFTGDRVVLISGGGVVRLPLTNAQIDVPQVYKAVTIGTSYATGIDQTFTPDGRALYPFSPVQLAGERETSGDLVISWVRRDRIGTELDPTGAELLMSEAVEAYEIEIFSDDSPVVLLRTLEASTTSVTYTAAEQAEDLGSPPPAEVFVRVYQISAVVGRGPPLEGFV
jgi:hypothetical protein